MLIFRRIILTKNLGELNRCAAFGAGRFVSVLRQKNTSIWSPDLSVRFYLRAAVTMPTVFFVVFEYLFRAGSVIRPVRT